jgi:hypothetical protein
MQRHLIIGQEFVTVLPMLQSYPSVDVTRLLEVAYAICRDHGDDTGALLGSPSPRAGMCAFRSHQARVDDERRC